MSTWSAKNSTSCDIYPKSWHASVYICRAFDDTWHPPKLQLVFYCESSVILWSFKQTHKVRPKTPWVLSFSLLSPLLKSFDKNDWYCPIFYSSIHFQQKRGFWVLVTFFLISSSWLLDSFTLVSSSPHLRLYCNTFCCNFWINWACLCCPSW